MSTPHRSHLAGQRPPSHATARRHVRRAALALGCTAAILTLAACGGGSSETGQGEASGSPEDLAAALEEGGTLTYWSWTPSAQAQVDAFEKAYPNVEVNLVNAGTGNDQYTKLQNAIKAGSGAPDVAQIEYQALPQFAIPGNLVDLEQYGFADLEDDYTPSTWGSVTVADGLYALPQDSGPMAMFYNKKVFDTYDLGLPTTWEEYVAAAEKLHEADPTKFITNDTGDAGFATSMIWQAGGTPFSSDGTDVTIDLQDEGTTRWTGEWDQLVENDLVAQIPGWSDEWFKALGDGTIASLNIGAWMPGVLESSVPQAKGDWRVAPIPTYDGTPATAENGGGGQSVLSQSANPALAAAFVQWLNNGDGVGPFLDSGGFPATTADLGSEEFQGLKSPYFGGQKINEVLVGAAESVVPGWEYLPYQLYANSVFSDTVGESYQQRTDLESGLLAWQDQLVSYGQKQGFTVNP